MSKSKKSHHSVEMIAGAIVLMMLIVLIGFAYRQKTEAYSTPTSTYIQAIK